MVMPKNLKNSYWQKRFEKRKNEGMVEAEVFNKNMAKRYKYIMQQLEKDVNYWYKRYAKENNLSLVEARKQLRAGELEAFKMTLEEYTTIAKDEHLSKELDTLLKNASLRVRMTRQEEIYITFAVRVEQALRALNQDFKPMLSKVYDDSYYKALYEVQNVVGYTATTVLPDGAIDTVLSNPWASDGKIFSTRIWENQNRLINTLRYELSQSLILQEGGAPLVGRIQKRLKVSFNDARRLVETETAFIQEQAFIDSMKSIKVKQYQIIATLDNRTSNICRQLDLKIFDMSAARVGVTTPPFHCYCRSTTVPYIAGVSDLDDTRAARVNGDGKTDFVKSTLSYDEWRKEYVKNGR